MTSVSVADGALLADKYRTVRVIGRGGMGVVLEARHELLDTRVAIKVLAAEALHLEGSTSRFLREARAAAGLRGEYVARVTDFGQLPDGRPFMVMELLEGEDLAAALERGLPRSDAIDAVLQACAGLAEAHAAGIVHRDLKPSNLFRARRPDGSICTKVVDFGISKLARADALVDATTRSSALLGTPYYMSPEQVRSAKTVDARTDVWQMGVVLYQALTGARPFDGDHVGTLFAQILEATPKRAREHAPDLPPDLDATVMAALEKAVDQRIPSIAELARRLEPFAGPEGRVAARRAVAMGGSTREVERAEASGTTPPMAAPMGAASAGDASSLDQHTEGTLSLTVAGIPRRRSPVVLAAGLTAIVGGAIAVWLVTRGADGPGADAAEPRHAAADQPVLETSEPVVIAPAVTPRVVAAIEASAAPQSPPPSASTSTPRPPPPARAAPTHRPPPPARPPSPPRPPSRPPPPEKPTLN